VIRGIIFDCFGVLCHGSLDYLRSIVPLEHLKELNDLSHSSDYGYISDSEYAEKVGELMGVPGAEVEGIIRAQCIRNEEMLNLVKSLRGECKTALLSNIGRGRIDKLFTVDELKGLFDTVVLSSEVGMVKPHVDIYQLTAERLGLDPSECIMIDDISVNVDGAVETGMKGLICADTKQCSEDLLNMLRSQNA